MSRSIVLIATLIAALLMIVSCEQPPATNASSANKPANANANSGTTTAVNHEGEVKKIMSEMAAALAKNDLEAASKFYAEDYHLVTPQGSDQDKAARMADMRSGSTKFNSFSYENIAVRSYGDTAVAIADVKATGTAAGQPVAANIKATLVFHKTKDGMKVVSGQATPVTATGAPASSPLANANTAADK